MGGFSGEELQRKVQQGRHKAYGSDRWKPGQWADLPDAFFSALASIWNAILGGCQLPFAWTQVRIVAIPKSDGGFRGLGIAAAAWRAGGVEGSEEREHDHGRRPPQHE